MTTEIKERPMLFNGEMVNAVLNGSKNQTRRVIKGVEGGDWLKGASCHVFDAKHKCPYGKVGDELWVREKWKYDGFTDGGIPFIKYAADGAVEYKEPSDDWCERVQDIWAELSDPKNYDIEKKAMDHKWRPSIHIPRWASRTQLKITNIRVERVQEISEEDCLGEGVFIDLKNAFAVKPPKLRDKFKELWDSINKESGYGWKVNPYVWVVDFERVVK